MQEDMRDNRGRRNEMGAEDTDDDEMVLPHEALGSRLLDSKKVVLKRALYEEACHQTSPVAWLDSQISASTQKPGWGKEQVFSSFSNCLSPTKYLPQSSSHAHPNPLSKPDLSWLQPSRHPLHTTYHPIRLFLKIYPSLSHDEHHASRHQWLLSSPRHEIVMRLAESNTAVRDGGWIGVRGGSAMSKSTSAAALAAAARSATALAIAALLAAGISSSSTLATVLISSSSYSSSSSISSLSSTSMGIPAAAIFSFFCLARAAAAAAAAAIAAALANFSSGLRRRRRRRGDGPSALVVSSTAEECSGADDAGVREGDFFLFWN
eukprot:CCRYP_006175-RD/>CCRYP_006175-RD protein AED:0.37 eAED:1.00 QI:0/0/0/1/0/0/3/0/320